VFAGSRGCGKTTTARILARALNCEKGPTPDPCGECDACVEIAQGRDIDVMEIDAASHTGIDNIREVVLAGLSIAPVRDRYKVFIIDEVHQLSAASFNALLKSVEEPPAHVVFMMATTEIHKIPDTILSRSQVFEFRSIPVKAILGQLRKIADAEGIEASDAALALIARAAEGSMRDAQSALDQVMAFSGTTMTVDDVSTVLGLVGRDLLFDLIEAVLDEDGPKAFALADRAVESGHDLKLVCRDLARVVRDVMILSVDPDRAGDGELAEGELERLTNLSGRFSREDVLRAFDVLARAEQDMKAAAHPRYHFEMALLRWMHVRKLVPLTELLDQMAGGGAPRGAPPVPASRLQPAAPRPSVAPRPASASPAPTTAQPLRTPAPRVAAPGPDAKAEARSPAAPARSAGAKPAASEPAAEAASAGGGAAGGLKDALLAEIRASRSGFYSMVVAQAQSIEVSAEGVVFAFLPTHRPLRERFEETRPWIEAAAERLAGRKVTVRSIQVEVGAAAPVAPAAAREDEPAASSNGRKDLKAEAMAAPAVQAVLEVFPAEIKDVEEL
jgi:DNA polymerase-3 subunit gamma/tau